MKPFTSKAARIVALVLRIALGLFFLVSAVAKLIGIDRFEIYVFSYKFLSLNLSFLAARLVIIAEIILGIGLISCTFKRLFDSLTILMLAGFTLFLGYAMLIGRTDSCQCMGSLLAIDPARSILKNALLMVLMVVAMGVKPCPWRPRWFVWLPVLLAPFVAIFILSAPDNWLFGPADEDYGSAMFDKAIQPDGDLSTLDLTQGRHVVALLTPACHFCQMADEKLVYIYRRNGLDSNAFVYVSHFNDTLSTGIQLDTISFHHSCYLVPFVTYAYITKLNQPMILLVDNGQVTATCNYRNIQEKDIVAFLRQEE